MSWEFIGQDSGLEVLKVEQFVARKKEGARTVEFLITIREKPRNAGAGPMRFFAQVDKQTNQNTGPYTPSGWGPSLEQALSACLDEINRFPYEGDEWE